MVDLVAVSMSIFVGKAPSNPNTAPIVQSLKSSNQIPADLSTSRHLLPRIVCLTKSVHVFIIVFLQSHGLRSKLSESGSMMPNVPKILSLGSTDFRLAHSLAILSERYLSVLAVFASSATFASLFREI